MIMVEEQVVGSGPEPILWFRTDLATTVYDNDTPLPSSQTSFSLEPLCTQILEAAEPHDNNDQRNDDDDGAISDDDMDCPPPLLGGRQQKRTVVRSNGRLGHWCFACGTPNEEDEQWMCPTCPAELHLRCATTEKWKNQIGTALSCPKCTYTFPPRMQCRRTFIVTRRARSSPGFCFERWGHHVIISRTLEGKWVEVATPPSQTNARSARGGKRVRRASTDGGTVALSHLGHATMTACLRDLAHV